MSSPDKVWVFDQRAANVYEAPVVEPDDEGPYFPRLFQENGYVLTRHRGGKLVWHLFGATAFATEVEALRVGLKTMADEYRDIAGAYEAVHQAVQEMSNYFPDLEIAGE